MALDPLDNSLLIGMNHIRLTRVSSTNSYAVDMISKSKPIEGTVISASYQYEGRGQIGRFWESEDKMNITCSTILQPSFLEAHDQFHLNIAVSLAVLDFVEHFLPDKDVKIKWPNDIYVGNKKIAGTLVQNSLKGKTINSAVIGTGININQTHFSQNIPNPTSFAIESGDTHVLDKVFPWLFRFLTKRYLQLKAGHNVALRKEYLNSLYRKDIWATYKLANGEFIKGRIKEVDKFGHLMIEDDNGMILQFNFREIKFIL